MAVLNLTLQIAAAQGKGLKFRHQPMTKGYQSGFTVMELMVVTLFIVVIGGMAVPNIQKSLSLYRLKASANLVATELNAGRVLAVSRSWLYEVSLTEAYEVGQNTFPSTIQIVDPDDSNNNPRVAQSFESDITFDEPPDPAIRFDDRGHARGGTIVLQNETGDTISVLVSASGRVKIQ